MFSLNRKNDTRRSSHVVEIILEFEPCGPQLQVDWTEGSLGCIGFRVYKFELVAESKSLQVEHR